MATNNMLNNTVPNNFSVTTATAGTTRTLTVSNTNNSNTASNALLAVTTGGASAGDAYHTVSTTTTTWAYGVDNSVTSPTADPFVISQSSTLGTKNVMSVATTGGINYPLQPAFFAYLPSTDLNRTGNGTAFFLGSGTALTEVFDQGSNFNTNGTFTAPQTGRYQFSCSVQITGCTIATAILVQIITTGTVYSVNWLTFRAATNLNLQQGGSVLINLTAGDTARVQVATYSEASATNDLVGDTQPSTYFSGYLVA